MSNAVCNCTASMLSQGFTGVCGSFELWVLFGVTTFLFLASLLVNVVFCCRRLKKNHGGSFPRHVRTRCRLPNCTLNFKSIEETPVYGNLSFLQAGDLLEDEKATELETSGQRLAVPQKMCYANLKATKTPVVQKVTDSGIQYADVVTLSKSNPETQANDAGKQKRAPTGAVMQGYPLYASVQTDRYRTLLGDQGYANN